MATQELALLRAERTVQPVSTLRAGIRQGTAVPMGLPSYTHRSPAAFNVQSGMLRKHIKILFLSQIPPTMAI